MTLFDFFALGLIGLSILLSLTRGVVAEIASLFTWVIAFMLAKWFSSDFARIALSKVEPQSLRYVVAFVLLFIIFWAIQYFFRALLTQAINGIGLGALNRFCGAIFGAARGFIIVVIVVLICAFTDLPQTPEWKNVQTATFFEGLALEVIPYLPYQLSEYIQYPD